MAGIRIVFSICWMTMNAPSTMAAKASGWSPHQLAPWKKATTTAINPATNGPKNGTMSSTPAIRPSTNANRTPRAARTAATTRPKHQAEQQLPADKGTPDERGLLEQAQEVLAVVGRRPLGQALLGAVQVDEHVERQDGDQGDHADGRGSRGGQRRQQRARLREERLQDRGDRAHHRFGVHDREVVDPGSDDDLCVGDSLQLVRHLLREQDQVLDQPAQLLAGGQPETGRRAAQ